MDYQILAEISDFVQNQREIIYFGVLTIATLSAYKLFRKLEARKHKQEERQTSSGLDKKLSP